MVPNDHVQHGLLWLTPLPGGRQRPSSRTRLSLVHSPPRLRRAPPRPSDTLPPRTGVARGSDIDVARLGAWKLSLSRCGLGPSAGGRGWATASCVGRNSVAGSLGKLSDTWVLNLTLASASDGSVEGRVTENVKGKEEVLIAAVKRNVRVLVGKVLTERQGFLILASAELGAAVKVDGAVKGTTPIRGKIPLAWGPHLHANAQATCSGNLVLKSRAKRTQTARSTRQLIKEQSAKDHGVKQCEKKRRQ